MSIRHPFKIIIYEDEPSSTAIVNNSMNTATEGKIATRFDVSYDVMEASNSMGEGGTFLQREGKNYRFHEGVVYEGMGFPFSAGIVRKVDEVSALPCFHWNHKSFTEMDGVFAGTGRENKIYLLLSKHKGTCWINDNRYFDFPCSIQGDGFIWPDSMYDVEHKIVDLLS